MLLEICELIFIKIIKFGAALVLLLFLGDLSAAPRGERYYQQNTGSFIGAFDVLDVFGGVGKFEYTKGCSEGQTHECKVKISVPIKNENYKDLVGVDDDASINYLNYMAYLERTGQPLYVEFEEILADSESEVAGYRVKYSTESKVRRFSIILDSRELPSVLKNNSLLLFSIMALSQSRLDLTLCPDRERSIYIKSMELRGLRPIDISISGRGGQHGYQYYKFPKDNELFLDVGGPSSINNISEGVGFRFVNNDRTQPPVRMVTGYHSDQKEWFISSASMYGVLILLPLSLLASAYMKNYPAIFFGLLLLSVEIRTGELQSLIRDVFPNELQFNPLFQGGHLLNTLRSSEEVE